MQLNGSKPPHTLFSIALKRAMAAILFLCRFKYLNIRFQPGNSKIRIQHIKII